MAVLEVQHLKKIYTTRFGGNRVQALSDVGFTVEQGEYVAIMGESGSGKTTLLNILAALDRPTSGSVLLDGTDLSTVKESGLAAFRRDNLGFVFQDFNLLDTFSVRDNILLPLVLSKVPYLEMECRLAPLADKLGLTELLDKLIVFISEWTSMYAYWPFFGKSGHVPYCISFALLLSSTSFKASFILSVLKARW